MRCGQEKVIGEFDVDTRGVPRVTYRICLLCLSARGYTPKLAACTKS